MQKQVLPFFKLIILILIIWSINLSAQDKDMPHGDDFKVSCDLCHSTSDWSVDTKKASFKHDETGFQLLGEHASVNCRSCHTDLVFNKIGHACADCHTDVHAGKLGIQCERCHTPVNWDNRMDIFKLHENSLFPLTGVHAILDCQSCHTTEQYNEYTNTGVECKSCHLRDYMQTINPAHQKSGFDLNCENCHQLNLNSWKNANYVHTDAFPLMGGHSNLECISCHENTYTNTPSECIACHQNDYNSAADPNHLTFAFPTVCERCHNINTWTDASFDHLVESGFALNGAHSSIQCQECHLDNQLTGLSRECYGCHMNDFNAVHNPDHIQGGFSRTCLDCHNENAWSPADFDHSQTAFPLTGAHASVNCTDCHTGGQYSGTPTNCYSCHEQDYLGAGDPNHVTNNFDKNCTTCHNTTSWEPANFDHSQTNFPLDGAHTGETCISCHNNGYSNTPTECVSCHQTEYNNTNDPDHTAAQFPSTCQDCHNTSAWQPAQWDHDSQYFPIYSGRHQEEWGQCSDCHVNTSDYTQFECITCHAHSDKNDVDSHHTEVSGYVYESNACYNCHPNGRSEGGGD